MKSTTNAAGVGALVAAALIAVLTIAQPSTASPAPSFQNVPENFSAVNPNRVLDTRETGRLRAGKTITVSTGVSGITAAGVNITMVRTDGPGFVTAWASGNDRPTASVINADGPGRTIANYVVVPTASNGTFRLYTHVGTDIVVDVMGTYASSGTTPPPSGTGFTATITGYSPLSSITTVVGVVRNNNNTTASVRVDVRCPSGTVEIDYVFDMPAGAERGWDVVCASWFTTGATVSTVRI
jgi:hypothetical protein